MEILCSQNGPGSCPIPPPPKDGGGCIPPKYGGDVKVLHDVWSHNFIIFGRIETGPVPIERDGSLLSNDVFNLPVRALRDATGRVKSMKEVMVEQQQQQKHYFWDLLVVPSRPVGHNDI